MAKGTAMKRKVVMEAFRTLSPRNVSTPTGPVTAGAGDWIVQVGDGQYLVIGDDAMRALPGAKVGKKAASKKAASSSADK